MRSLIPLILRNRIIKIVDEELTAVLGSDTDGDYQVT